MSTEEKNEVIAKFMGFSVIESHNIIRYEMPRERRPKGAPYSGGFRAIQMQFISSWEWLMPVVQEVSKLQRDWPLATDDVLSLPISSPIELVYEKVYQFAEWYNSNVKEK